MDIQKFDKIFRETWSLLEHGQPAQDKIGSYWKILKNHDSQLVARTFLFFGKVGRPTVGARAYTGFPTGPQFLERLRMLRDADRSKEIKEGGRKDNYQHQSDEQIQAEFDRWLEWNAKNPMPDYRVGETEEDCEMVDKNYQRKMRKAGFDPDEVNPRANALFVKHLNSLGF